MVKLFIIHLKGHLKLGALLHRKNCLLQMVKAVYFSFELNTKIGVL